MDERRKVYVSVNADHDTDGDTRPNRITFEDGQKYDIDRLLDRRRAASLKVGGTGIRYTVRICGQITYLYEEDDGRWFVEAKARS